MRRSIWFWLLVVVVLIILLGLLFGGYRKGQKVGAPTPAPTQTVSVIQMA
jgi:hypothetical protein